MIPSCRPARPRAAPVSPAVPARASRHPRASRSTRAEQPSPSVYPPPPRCGLPFERDGARCAAPGDRPANTAFARVLHGVLRFRTCPPVGWGTDVPRRSIRPVRARRGVELAGRPGRVRPRRIASSSPCCSRGRRSTPLGAGGGRGCCWKGFVTALADVVWISAWSPRIVARRARRVASVRRAGNVVMVMLEVTVSGSCTATAAPPPPSPPPWTTAARGGGELPEGEVLGRAGVHEQTRLRGRRRVRAGSISSESQRMRLCLKRQSSSTILSHRFCCA